jgi:Uma2 family endonuclease
MMETLAEPQVHLWTRDEFYQLGEFGLFKDKRIELIEGQVIETSPLGALHMTYVTVIGDILRELFGVGYFIRTQGPLDLGEIAQPQPDIAVIAGKATDYRNVHPTTAVLVIEVAESSLTYDRTVKTSLYAKAGLAEYWIVNLIDNQLEIYRQPQAERTAQFGFSYGQKQVFKVGGVVSPLARPDAQIAVAHLLP